MSEISYIFAKTRLSMEIWRDIKGYEGLYQVSNEGRVKSLKRKIILKQQTIKGGYLRVHLWKNGKCKHKIVSVLVYETFIGDIPEDLQVNHKDENKSNNKVENLNLLTSQDNNNWGTRNERSRQSQLNDEKKSKKVKVYKYPSMEFVGIFPSRKEIERKLKCFNVKKVIDGIYKQEKGYTFENV